MYDLDYVFDGDRDVPVWTVRKTCATKRMDIREIEHLLDDKCSKEATKLYRLAWRMIGHGCSKESVEKCRSEARALDPVGGMNRWDVLNPFVVWEYAWKC